MVTRPKLMVTSVGRMTRLDDQYDIALTIQSGVKALKITRTPLGLIQFVACRGTLRAAARAKSSSPSKGI